MNSQTKNTTMTAQSFDETHLNELLSLQKFAYQRYPCA